MECKLTFSARSSRIGERERLPSCSRRYHILTRIVWRKKTLLSCRWLWVHKLLHCTNVCDKSCPCPYTYKYAVFWIKGVNKGESFPFVWTYVYMCRYICRWTKNHTSIDITRMYNHIHKNHNFVENSVSAFNHSLLMMIYLHQSYIERVPTQKSSFILFNGITVYADTNNIANKMLNTRTCIKSRPVEIWVNFNFKIYFYVWQFKHKSKSNLY